LRVNTTPQMLNRSTSSKYAPMESHIRSKPGQMSDLVNNRTGIGLTPHLITSFPPRWWWCTPSCTPHASIA